MENVLCIADGGIGIEVVEAHNLGAVDAPLSRACSLPRDHAKLGKSTPKFSLVYYEPCAVDLPQAFIYRLFRIVALRISLYIAFCQIALWCYLGRDRVR